jgi:hypothetical protein
MTIFLVILPKVEERLMEGKREMIRELQSMIFDAVSQHRTGSLSMETFKTRLGRHMSATQTIHAEPAPAYPR